MHCSFAFGLLMVAWLNAHAEYNFTARSGVLDSVHPDFTITSLLPGGVPNKVVGMDWLPNGDMAVLAMQDSIHINNGGGHGWVHILSGARAAPAVTPSFRTIYYGFEHPMGLAVAEGAIHVSQREKLVRLIDVNSDGSIDSLATIAAYPDSKMEGGWGRWALNLRYRDGIFYTGLGAYHFVNEPGPCLPWSERGLVHAVNTQGQTQKWGKGLREPNGIGFGPEGEIFATDNDGEWVAANRLVHVRQDEFYGLVPCDSWDASLKYSLPAIWFPKHLRSPGQPLLMTQGKFTGQMLVGDYVVPNLSRIFLEKVNDRYQGALFPMTGGLASGGLRLLSDEDGAIYVGELTIENYESWWVHSEKRPAPGALEKLTPKSSTAFEMLAIRAQKTGMEIEFTHPVAASASDTAGYCVRQWRLKSTFNYGSPKIDSQDLAVTEARLSDDKRKVQLTLPKLKAGYVVQIQLHDEFRAADNSRPWAYEAWYTLNAIPGIADLQPQSKAQPRLGSAKMSLRRIPQGGHAMAFELEGRGDFRLLDIQGQEAFESPVTGQEILSLPTQLKGRFYLGVLRMPDGVEYRQGIPLF